MPVAGRLIGALAARIIVAAAPAILIADDTNAKLHPDAVRVHGEIGVGGILSEEAWQRSFATLQVL